MFRSVLPLALLSACDTRVAPDRVAMPERSGSAAGIDVWFCPQDDTVSVELAEIARVVEARKADPGLYPDGANPYRIGYAVYNLRNPDLVYALADAHDAGVDVQVIVDGDQLDPERDWNWADDYLCGAVADGGRGFACTTSLQAASITERRELDLLGYAAKGLFHTKLRLFETPDERTVITGSMNPGDDAVFNDETFHVVTDSRVTARYAAYYEAVLTGAPIVNEWTDGAGLNVLFNPEKSGPDAGARLLEWIRDEDEQVLLMVFSLRDLTAPGVSGSLLSILGDKVRQGVPVVLVTDRNQSDGYPDSTEDRLRGMGVHVYEASNEATEFTAMHHKVAVLGRTEVRVVTDAANWSKAGLGSASSPADNQESTLFYESSYDDGAMGRRYLGEFVRVLATYADQSAGDGEPSFAALAPSLLGHPDWPLQAVAFEARAETAWGEEIHVVGDLPELGDWARGSAGVPLATDGEHYPVWTSPEPLVVPLGTPFRWKLVAVDGSKVRWEGGDDRVDFAMPGPLEGDVTALRATWR